MRQARRKRFVREPHRNTGDEKQGGGARATAAVRRLLGRPSGTAFLGRAEAAQRCVGTWQSDGRAKSETTGDHIGTSHGDLSLWGSGQETVEDEGPRGVLVSQGPSGCLVGAVWAQPRKGPRYSPSISVPCTMFFFITATACTFSVWSGAITRKRQPRT